MWLFSSQMLHFVYLLLAQGSLHTAGLSELSRRSCLLLLETRLTSVQRLQQSIKAAKTKTMKGTAESRNTVIIRGFVTTSDSCDITQYYLIQY